MKRTVLVIDDDKMILDMMQGVLADKFDVSAVMMDKRHSAYWSVYVRILFFWI